jgi:signal transduction histidine kinase
MSRRGLDWSAQAIAIVWTARWGWILLAALVSAWSQGAPRLVLAIVTAYGLTQVLVTALFFLAQRNGLAGWLGLVIDIAGPLAFSMFSAGQPLGLYALLLAPVFSTTVHLGGQAGLALGLLADLVLLGLGWTTAAAIPLSAGLGLLILSGQLLAAFAAVRVKSMTWPISSRPVGTGSDLPAVARELADQLPPAELPMDGQQLLRATLDLGLEVLAATGLRMAELSGLALFFDGASLSEVGRRSLDESEPLSFKAREGALADARQHGTIIQIPRVTGDAELGAEAKRLDWGSAACVSIDDGEHCLGVLVFGHQRPRAFDPEKLEGLHALAQQARVALRFAELYQEQVNERIRLGEIQEEARKKLARDLHDGPTQVIAAIAMRTNFARRQLSRDPESAKQELEKVETMARTTTREIRHMLFTLRPLILESQGLTAALRQFAEKVRDTHNQKVHLEAELEAEQELSQASQVALFYIIEEAVTNAYKHAAAENIWIRLVREEAGVLAEVSDDGVGFNVGEVDAHYELRGSLGMVTMRERAELLAGSLEIASEQGRGTTIRVHIPSDQAAETR